MHSSYTNRKGVEKSLRMINTLSAIQLSKNLSHHLRSVSSQVCLHNLQPAYSKLSCSSYSSQASLFAVFAHWKTVVILQSLSENVINCMRCTVALNYSLSRHTEYIQQIYNENPAFNSLVLGSLRLTPIKSWLTFALS